MRPKTVGIHRRPNPGKQPRLKGRIGEEAAARSGVDDARLADDAKAFQRRPFIPAEDDHGAGTHVFLFADDPGDTVGAVVGKRLGRIFEEPLLLARFAGRHRGGQVDEPLRVGRKAAHRFQGGHRVLFSDRDLGAEPRGDDPLAQHVLGIEQIVVEVLAGHRGFTRHFRQERSSRFAVGRAAATETNSRSGHRRAVSFPPKTQPESMFVVRLSHSGSGTGVCP